MLVESNRFVTLPGVPQFPYSAVFAGISEVAMQNGASDVCTSVRLEHVKFYEKFFGMQRISDSRVYPDLKTEMVLMWANQEMFSWRGLKRVSNGVVFRPPSLKIQPAALAL